MVAPHLNTALLPDMAVRREPGLREAAHVGPRPAMARGRPEVALAGGRGSHQRPPPPPHFGEW